MANVVIENVASYRDGMSNPGLALQIAVLACAATYKDFPRSLQTDGGFQIAHEMRSPDDVSAASIPILSDWYSRLGQAADIVRTFPDHVNFTWDGINFNGTRALEAIIKGSEARRGKVVLSFLKQFRAGTWRPSVASQAAAVAV